MKQKADNNAHGSSRDLGRALISLVIPETPRGRVRRSVAIIIILMLFSGLMSYPNWWNRTADTVNTWSKNKLGFNLQLPGFWEIAYHLGLDLQGGTHLVYIADMSSIPAGDQAEAMAGVRDVIERRVNAFGVSEPLVQTDESGNQHRLVVDLAGVTNVADAIKLIGETPILEFKERNTEPPRALTAAEQKDMNAKNAAAMSKAKSVLKKTQAAGADFTAIAAESSEDMTTKSSGGDLGWQGKDGQYGELVQQVIATGAQPGTVVPRVLEGIDGYQVVRYMEKRESGKEVEVSHILICWKGATSCEQERTKAESLTMVKDLLNKVNKDNFGELAKQNSNDTSNAATGGALGWFKQGMMVKEFDEAAFSMQVGQIGAAPVETQFGYHILYKTGERPIEELHLSHIQFNKKTATDYVPAASEWKNTALSGKQLTRAAVQFTAQTNEPMVSLKFNDEGKKLFGEITNRNVGQPVAIFLDGQPISIPTVREPITDGEAIISGSFTIPDAKLLAQRLNAGALPVPVTLETQQSVGATLGSESLDASLKAGLIGFLVVALFMLGYYRLPGLISIIALAVYTAINLMLYKLIPVTLSLSGIAGFILSVGMAVDANVLIFERLKEELRRGRTLQSAMEEAFRRAWLSIRDSNFTTLISCAILFYTSSSLIKGFALTLALGVLVSMFTAIVVSRTLLRLCGGWSFLKSSFLYMPGLSRGVSVKDSGDSKKN